MYVQLNSDKGEYTPYFQYQNFAARTLCDFCQKCLLVLEILTQLFHSESG